MIGERVSKLSSSAEVFNKEIPVYSEALQKAGYKKKLEYQPTKKPKSRCGKKSVVWFNPPFSKAVSTNFGAKFLKLLDQHFPKDQL